MVKVQTTGIEAQKKFSLDAKECFDCHQLGTKATRKYCRRCPQEPLSTAGGLGETHQGGAVRAIDGQLLHELRRRTRRVRRLHGRVRAGEAPKWRLPPGRLSSAILSWTMWDWGFTNRRRSDNVAGDTRIPTAKTPMGHLRRRRNGRLDDHCLDPVETPCATSRCCRKRLLRSRLLQCVADAVAVFGAQICGSAQPSPDARLSTGMDASGSVAQRANSRSSRPSATSARIKCRGVLPLRGSQPVRSRSTTRIAVQVQHVDTCFKRRPQLFRCSTTAFSSE
jgi:hypothetical protein